MITLISRKIRGVYRNMRHTVCYKTGFGFLQKFPNKILNFGSLCVQDMWGLGCIVWEVYNGPLGKAMKSSPLLGPIGDSEFWEFSLLKM
jgi:hypothetical protein